MAGKKIAVGQQVDMAKRFTMSAASLIQREAESDQQVFDNWSMIIEDLERALKHATRVADELAMWSTTDQGGQS